MIYTYNLNPIEYFTFVYFKFKLMIGILIYMNEIIIFLCLSEFYNSNKRREQIVQDENRKREKQRERGRKKRQIIFE